MSTWQLPGKETEHWQHSWVLCTDFESGKFITYLLILIINESFTFSILTMSSMRNENLAPF